MFAAERRQDAGREHRRQRRRKGRVPRVQRVDQEARNRATAAGLARLHAAANVLAERGERVVFQAPSGDARGRHHHRRSLARPVPRRRPVVQHEGVQSRLRVSAGLQDEPGEQVPSVVIAPPRRPPEPDPALPSLLYLPTLYHTPPLALSLSCYSEHAFSRPYGYSTTSMFIMHALYKRCPRICLRSPVSLVPSICYPGPLVSAKTDFSLASSGVN